jgi:outer membrane lipoprotein-sorting protein
MQGEFTQVGPAGNTAEGYFVLDRPGKLLFRYKPPVKVEIIADGSALMIRDRKAGTRDLWPIGQTPLRFLLEKNVSLDKETRVLSVETRDDLTTVLVEETTIAGTGRIALVVNNETMEIQQWTITDPQGLDTTVALYNVEYGLPTDPKWFYINHQLNREN